jgi:hypothetical protein
VTPERTPQTAWAPPGTVPLSDAQAAALVTHTPENRPANVRVNDYVPTNAQLRAFHAAHDDTGTLADTDVPTRKYVTGRPGLNNPSTDDLIQWVAHKWGIPEDWIRAQMIVESGWNQMSLGDRAPVSPAWYRQYPVRARVPGSNDVFQSMGVSQVKWKPDGSNDAGTEPLRWESTAFALDFYAAEVRYFYDGDCSWCGPGYSAGQAWNSIGAWARPTPWNNPEQENYIRRVQNALRRRAWSRGQF